MKIDVRVERYDTMKFKTFKNIESDEMLDEKMDKFTESQEEKNGVIVEWGCEYQCKINGEWVEYDLDMFNN